MLSHRYDDALYTGIVNSYFNLNVYYNPVIGYIIIIL